MQRRQHTHTHAHIYESHNDLSLGHHTSLWCIALPHYQKHSQPEMSLCPHYQPRPWPASQIVNLAGIPSQGLVPNISGSPPGDVGAGGIDP